MTPGGSFVILCKLTIMAICTDIELLEAPLLRAVTKISLVFGSDVRRGKSGTFETEASRSVTGHPHIAKKYRAAKTPALDEVPGRHLLGSAVVRSVHQHTPRCGAAYSK
jgi:hypothetical protein